MDTSAKAHATTELIDFQVPQDSGLSVLQQTNMATHLKISLSLKKA